ncbi:MAG: phage holin family protein [Dissulfurispiraceae bacterium]
MAYLILKILINSLAISAAVRLIDGITFSGPWWKMILIGTIFGLINSLIKPLVKFLTLPFIILTLGLFTLLVNALMLALTVALSRPLNLGLQINGFKPAFWGAIVVSLVNVILSRLTGLRTIKYWGNKREV